MIWAARKSVFAFTVRLAVSLPRRAIRLNIFAGEGGCRSLTSKRFSHDDVHSLEEHIHRWFLFAGDPAFNFAIRYPDVHGQLVDAADELARPVEGPRINRRPIDIGFRTAV